MSDTIYAPATVPGKAGVAVVRLSGPHAWQSVVDLCGTLPAPRTLGLRTLRDASREILDTGLVVVFEHGGSYTGERMAELHLHGSRAVIQAVLSELGTHRGLRYAEPGEFTRRALENGRLNLSQVEGLADLIDAETEGQRKQAQRVLSGALGDKARSWRAALMRARASLEVTIDFADEDLPDGVMDTIMGDIQSVVEGIAEEQRGLTFAERIRDGFEVAIIGAPNVGKSTLLNRLAGRDAAIVSHVSGTTRDVIEVRMDIDGLPVTLLDTAGLHETIDPVEQIGVERALARADAADVRVFLHGETQPLLPVHRRDGDIVVQGMADLYPRSGLRVSGRTGEGVAELLKAIGTPLAKAAAYAGVATRTQHRVALSNSSSSLRAAADEMSQQARPEIISEHLYEASSSLAPLIGEVATEELLGEIFASFCIGK